MALKAIETACSSLADDIWSNSRKSNGFALLKKPRPIHSISKHLKNNDPETFEDDPDVFWKIDNHSLVRLTWGSGTGSDWAVFAFCLPSGRRVYVQSDDNSGSTVILSVSAKNWNPHIDLKFLQRLFKDNGASFGTGVLSTPPNHVIVRSNSFPFIVDLFVAAFDAAGQECWDNLLDNWNVWNEEYENPPDPIEPSQTLFQEVSAKDIGKYGAPKSFETANAHQARVEKTLQSIMHRDDLNEFINKNQSKKRSPQEPQEKLRIVARYLGHVLTTES